MPETCTFAERDPIRVFPLDDHEVVSIRGVRLQGRTPASGAPRAVRPRPGTLRPRPGGR
ncbi:hypothetical protein ACWDCL_24420 [Streptomyces sp. NPDC001009]